LCSPRIFLFTLGEEFFAESPRGGSRQRLLLSAKELFPVVPMSSLADDLISMTCAVPPPTSSRRSVRPRVVFVTSMRLRYQLPQAPHVAALYRAGCILPAAILLRSSSFVRSTETISKRPVTCVCIYIHTHALIYTLRVERNSTPSSNY
jgi:hypothetical protein